jgi:hypothetical protein
MVRTAVVLGFFAAALLAPRAASAITLDEVISLSKAGVTERVILALIDRDQTVFAIQPDQIVKLQRDGLSETLILAMLKSGRTEGELAAHADAAFNSAWIVANLPTEPLSVSVGHGPDRPNTPHLDGFYSGPPVYAGVTVPYYGPAFRYRTPSLGSRRAKEPPALCYAQTATAHSMSGTRFVTVCPAVLQPGHERR